MSQHQINPTLRKVLGNIKDNFIAFVFIKPHLMIARASRYLYSPNVSAALENAATVVIYSGATCVGRARALRK
jgi:hypothetical protein